MSHLATEFTFGEHGKDQSAWLLYSARYTEEQLSLKRKQIIRILDTIVTLKDDKIKGIVATMQDGGNLTENAKLLLEELDILSEAIDFHGIQPNLTGRGLSHLISYDRLTANTNYPEGFSNQNDDKFAFLYSMSGLLMDTIIRAQIDGIILHSQQEKLLKQLHQDRETSMEMKTHSLDQGNGVLYAAQFSPGGLAILLESTLFKLQTSGIKLKNDGYGFMFFTTGERRVLTLGELILFNRFDSLNSAFALHQRYPHLFGNGLEKLLHGISSLADEQVLLHDELATVLTELLLLDKGHPLLTLGLRKLLIEVDTKVKGLGPAGGNTIRLV